jgi:hypothetical protein
MNALIFVFQRLSYYTVIWKESSVFLSSYNIKFHVEPHDFSTPFDIIYIMHNDKTVSFIVPENARIITNRIAEAAIFVTFVGDSAALVPSTRSILTYRESAGHRRNPSPHSKTSLTGTDN